MRIFIGVISILDSNRQRFIEMNWRTRVKINCSPFPDRSPSVLILGYYRDDRSWDRSLDPCAVFVRIENLIFAGPGGTRTCAPVRLWVKF